MAARRERSHELDAAERNAMSDSTYAFPRVRKEPLNDASYAIARFDQVRDVTDEERREAFRRIQRAADKVRGGDVGEALAGPRQAVGNDEVVRQAAYADQGRTRRPGPGTGHLSTGTPP
jgi:hypothetical protein